MSATTIQLNNGLNFPLIGLGTWQAKPGQVQAAVVAAIEAGYRHIDCAFVYGNEQEIGEGLRMALEDGKVKREELFITSKLWNTKHHASDVKPALTESLNRLGLDYLDLYLIHWPITFKAGVDVFPRDEQGELIYDNVHYLEPWHELEKCFDEGLVRSIGLSNFNSQQIQDVIDNSRIKPAVLQVEISPYFQQEKLVKFCQDRGLAVTAFSSFGSPDRPWADKSEPSLLDNPVLQRLAERCGKSPAQVVLRWLVQRRIASIPKSVTPSRIQQNLQVFDFTLSPEDMEVMKTLERNQRAIIPVVDRNGVKEYRDKAAAHFPFHIEF